MGLAEKNVDRRRTRKRGDDDDDDELRQQRRTTSSSGTRSERFCRTRVRGGRGYVGHFFEKFLSSAFTGRDDDDGKHDVILTNASLETAVNIRTLGCRLR